MKNIAVDLTDVKAVDLSPGEPHVLQIFVRHQL